MFRQHIRDILMSKRGEGERLLYSHMRRVET